MFGASPSPLRKAISVRATPSSPRRRAPAAPRSSAAHAPLIAFCHLSWDGVWQRPQQLLSRLALSHPVLFVETYCSDVPASTTRLRAPLQHPNVTVLEMHLPASAWHDGNFIDLERRRLLRNFRAGDGGRFDDPVLWFNDPMAVTAFAGHCDERAIVYDCMDELSQFKGAPAQLVERERELVALADVVFCGGRKMREKRLPLNRNCHFYSTGVDCRHFGSALSSTLPVHPDIAALPGKILGYFGVIDERIDYELLAKLADANPRWSIAMVGPTAKVDPAEFPRRHNLHWLGGRAYQDLPAITKGFSACLMPFALNAATEFINPTKALEYMATGRPVVSTALDEVKSNFSQVSRIARTHSEFIIQCLEETTSPNQTRIKRGLALASQNTWEVITSQMDAHIANAIDARQSSAIAESATSPSLLTGQLNHV